MSPPASDLIRVTEVPGAGRGVLASGAIRTSLCVWQCPRPAAHVIFWQYRKEVCAQCFYYDRGRTLAVRLNDIAKVFCSKDCEEQWLMEQGALGYGGWKMLKTLVTAKSTAVTNSHSLPDLGPRPQVQAVAMRWKKAGEAAQAWCAARRSKVEPVEAEIEAKASYQAMVNAGYAQAVDPDILAFLLSGMLFHCHHPHEWAEAVLPLTRDEQAYRSIPELEAYCNSFLQLVAMLPVNLLPSCTAEVCLTLVSTASHNSFGIRSGGEDGEEYMGYGLYPSASYFNHSCAPNISKERTGRSWAFSASKEIPRGAECCISYLGGDENDMTAHERRERLKAHWGFECQCARCSSDERSSN